MDALACISKARSVLSKATRISEVMEVRNTAEAIRTYIKAAGESLEAQNAAADIRLQCERKVGELLAVMDKHDGDPRSQDATRLSDLGINKSQSSRWQLASSLPEDDYRNAISKELTQSCILTAARKRKELRNPHVDVEETPVADLELVGEVRMQLAKWIDEFGPDRLDVLVNVLESEIAGMEVQA